MLERGQTLFKNMQPKRKRDDVTPLDKWQTLFKTMRSTRKGTAALLVLMVLVPTAIGAVFAKASAQCPTGEQCLSPDQYVAHFKNGDLGRVDGVHPNKRFAAPIWTKDYVVHRLANRLSTNMSELNDAYAATGLTPNTAAAYDPSLACGTLPELCVASKMYDQEMANSSCVPRGKYFYRSNLCAGAYGTNPITKQNVKDGIHIGICSGTLVFGVAGAPEDIPILMTGGLGFMGCMYSFLDNW